MKTAYIEVNDDCNLKCVFCSRGDSKGSLNKPGQVRALLKKFAEQGYKKAVFTGGETLLNPELDTMVKDAVGLGFETAVQTNGILMTKKMAEKLKLAGLEQAIFSIHSHMPVMVDRLMQGNGVLKKQLTGLENAHKAGMFTPITTLILRQNYRILPQFFEFIATEYPFVEHFTLNFVDPIGRAEKNSWTVPKLSEAELPLLKALLVLDKAKKTFRVERVPLCYMLEFAESNTELRRMFTSETAVVYRGKESTSYTDFYWGYEYKRGTGCEQCWLKKVCPGVDKHYVPIHGTDELYPIFIEPETITRRSGAD